MKWTNIGPIPDEKAMEVWRAFIGVYGNDRPAWPALPPEVVHVDVTTCKRCGDDFMYRRHMTLSRPSYCLRCLKKG